MQVLVISSEPFAPQALPLASIYVHDQAKLLVAQGFEVGLLTVAYLPVQHTFLASKCFRFENCDCQGIKGYSDVRRKVVPIALIPHWLQRKIQLKRGLKLFEKYLSTYGSPDIVHSHNCFFAGALALEIFKRYRIPFIHTEHSSVFFTDRTDDEIKLLKEIYRSASIFTTVSNALMAVIYQLTGKLSKPIRVLPNALDILFEETPLQAKAKSVDFVFINIANLVDVKGHDVLIRAFAEKFADVVNVKLKIVGTGPNLEKLQALSRSLGIGDKVLFVGYLEKEKIILELDGSDVFVMSSHFETFGIVIMEALSRGKPVISTRSQGPEMLVENTNGIMVPANNFKALGQAMLEVYEGKHHFDAPTIRKECLKKFGRSAFSERVSELYKEALDRDLSGR